MTRIWPKIITGLGALIGILTLYQALRRTTMPPNVQLTGSESSIESVPEVVSNGSGQARILHKPYSPVRARLFSSFLLLASAALTVPYILHNSSLMNFILSPPVASVLSRHLYIGKLLLLLALALSAFIVIRRRSGWIAKSAVTFIIVVQIFVLAAVVFVGIYGTADPVDLLENTAITICGLGIILSIPAFWLRGHELTEPIAIGVIAISLGILCLPGLHMLTMPLNYPNIYGAGLLFATGPADQGLRLNVSNDIFPSGEPGTASSASQTITIENMGKRRIHWVMLLVSDARLIRSSLSQTKGEVEYRNIHVVARTTRYPPFISGIGTEDIGGAAQLFSGTLGGGSTATISGISSGFFVTNSFSRTAVSLPDYGQGNLSSVSREGDKAVLNALHGKPTVRPTKYFAVQVSDGNLSPSQSVTQSTPALASDLQNPGDLGWTDHSDILVTYAVVDQNAVDTTNNVLFVFAILLGIAGAALLTSLQGIIHAISSRTNTDRGADTTTHPGSI